MAASKIELAPLGPEHAEAMFACLGDRTAYRFVPDEPPATLVELRERYERLAVGGSVDGCELWFNWMVRDRQSGLAFGFTQATLKQRSALIAYHLAPSFWRRGIGTEALWQTARMLFDRVDVDRLHALVDTRNVASAALLGKLGFVEITRVAHADFFKGESSDEIEFELTRIAWISGAGREVGDA